MMPANSTNVSKSMRLKNNKNGPTKATVNAPAHKPLADALLIDLRNKTVPLRLVMECWSIRILEYWSVGVLECCVTPNHPSPPGFRSTKSELRFALTPLRFAMSLLAP
jgi:hypothetical protein